MRRREDALAESLRRLGQPWELGLFGALPLFMVSFIFWFELSRPKSLVDFAIFRAAASAVIHGHSPYGAGNGSGHGVEGFVYPPVTGLLFAPFALLPNAAARVLMLILGVVAVAVALRLLDVRDWRCYGLALLMAPTLNSITLGAITPLLLCGAAAAWRYRDRAAIVGVASAATAVAKIFVWPLGVWLLVRSRRRAGAIFVAAAILLIVGGWAVIGFSGLTSYPHLLHVVSRREALKSYSPIALARLSGGPALALSVALTLAVVAGVAAAARGADGERRAFSVALAGALLATPVLWLHYFMLLLVPIALYRPRLSGLWFVPLAFWATPQTIPDGASWKIALALAIAAVVLGRLLLAPDGNGRSRRRPAIGPFLARTVPRAADQLPPPSRTAPAEQRNLLG